MSTDEEKQTALVPVEPNALIGVGARSLAARASRDLRIMEEAQYWLRKGKELAERAGDKFTWAKTDQERQDDEEGFRCFGRGHELSPSNPEIQYWLARAYHWGFGVGENPVKASALYLRASALGYCEAQFSVANQYSGHEVSQWAEFNCELAVRWYRAAAEQGHAKAQWMLGDCYAFGLGVQQNDDEAIAWALKASNQGDEGGQRLLTALESRKHDGKPLNVLGYSPAIGYRQ